MGDVAVKPYVRLVREGAERRLELCLRTLRRVAGEGPSITLASTSHVAEPEFYGRVQAVLDAQRVVLFEGVVEAEPERSGEGAAGLSDDERARITRHNQWWLALFAERYRRRHGRYPATSDELVAGLHRRSARLARWALHDGWGRQQEFTARRGAVEVVSLGADGKPGGEGHAADIRRRGSSDVPRRAVIQRGLYADTARALGLADQGEHIDIHGPQWRRCDRTMEQLQAHARADFAQVQRAVKIISGRSVVSRVASLVMWGVGLHSGVQRMVKILAAEVIDSVYGDGALQGEDEDFSPFERSVIEYRNQCVVDEIRRVLRDERPASIGVLFGAAHMKGIEEGVRAMGYEPAEDEWAAALVVRCEKGERLDVPGMIAEGLVKLVR